MALRAMGPTISPQARRVLALGALTLACSSPERSDLVADSVATPASSVPATPASASAAPSALQSVGTGAKPLAASPRTLACGDEVGCSILSDGRVACWGYDSLGQLGGGKAIAGPARLRPARVVDGLPPARSIAVGLAHACALTTSSEVYCWGEGSGGELGDGGTLDPDRTTRRVLPPTKVRGLPGNVVAIDLSNAHSCAVLDDGRVACWGDNTYGGFGTSGPSSAVPVLVPGLTEVAEIAVGTELNCARTVRGVVQCWGRKKADLFPPEVVPGICARQITVAFTLGCAIDCDGKVRCWGDLPGYANHSDTPVLIEELVDIEELRGGLSHVLARDRAGALYAWGGDDSGQLGRGKPKDWMSDFADRPVKVPVPWKQTTELAAGGIVTRQNGKYLRAASYLDAGASCARSEKGDVYGWGEPGLDYVPKKITLPR